MWRKAIFLLLFFTFSVILKSQTKRLFDYNEGLSNSLINQVFQDKKGFIWVATENGLNRFDGIKFLSFSQNSDQDNALNASFVNSVYEDSDGNLWVGQVNGVQVYNHISESFETIEIYVNNERIYPYVSKIIESKSGDIWVATSGFGIIKIDKKTRRPRYSTKLNKKICSFYLESIYSDDEGMLWIGSDNHGLDKLNPETGESWRYSITSKDNYKLPFNDISDISADTEGNILIASIKGGILKIDKKTGQKEQFFTEEGVSYPVKSILYDSKGTLWVGTDGYGLKFIPKGKKYLQTFAPSSTTFDFSKSKVHSIIEDDAGNLWLGVYQKGLFLIPDKPEIFLHYGYKAFGENSLGSNYITSIDGEDSTLWIGTDGDGIYKLNTKNQAVEHIIIKDVYSNLNLNSILSLYNTPDDILWIGTFSNGLISYNKNTGYSKFYKNNPDDENSLINDKVTVIVKNGKGELVLGTLGGGICRFDVEKGIFYKGLSSDNKYYKDVPKWVNDILIDSKGNYWIGTYDGLVFIDTKANKSTLFTKLNGMLPHNLVYCIQEDSDETIWVGTYNGLVKVKNNGSDISFIDKEIELGSNTICAIEEDANKELWISTHNGLSRLDPKSMTVTNYFAYDGLQSNEFSNNASYVSKSGALFFSGINGVSEVKKDYKKYSRNVRDVMLTDFFRFDKPVKIGELSGDHVILNKSIVLADTVKLAEHDNVFSIGFTSVELANQSRITYEYMMEGFDKGWNTSNSRSRMATYTNLKHGTYVFNIRGVDKGRYSKSRKLTIIIYPPWYKTVYAKLLYAVIALLLMYGGISLFRERVRRRQTEELTEMKMQFFINISHEIKTPLTLILDPLEKLLSMKVDKKTKELYHIMHRNSSRIFRLINQLLDVRKVDKGQLLFKYQNTNIFDFIGDVAEPYKYVASEKGIEFSIIAENQNIDAWIDPLNFEKVILNLLSNAFKFTPKGGVIELKISDINNSVYKDGFVEISVSDTGVGIKNSELEKIFNRFYQVYSKDRRENTGTGIGLHLSRNLVEMHKGKLFAENRSDMQGSRFVIILPLGNEHLPKEDLITEDTILPAPSNKISYSPFTSNLQKVEKGEEISSSTYKIMIVEDEEDIRNYLKNQLSATYQVIGYENGKVAFNNVIKDKPDLIISDIMMPEMDGIEFCKKVKANSATNHTPVILLTALSKDEDRAEGIETGADMYISKPFNSEFLKISIKNILENRRKIYEQFNNEKVEEQTEEGIKSQDEILVQKVMSIIKEHIANPKLNVEMLADKVGISRAHMYRKLKNITNQSANDFIKNIRMKQAAYLLVAKNSNVSEVAYAVGYSNLSHFSNSFKTYYGVSPSEYVQMQNKKVE